MHTRRSVFLKHEDAQERDSGKVLQPFNSSRHYLFNNKRKRLREQSDFHGQNQALVLRGERIIGSDFCACQEEMQKKGLTAGEAREELLILTHLFCMLLYSVLSEYDFQLFPPLSNGCFILFSHSSQHKKIIILHVHTQCFSYSLIFSTLKPGNHPSVCKTCLPLPQNLREGAAFSPGAGSTGQFSK